MVPGVCRSWEIQRRCFPMARALWDCSTELVSVHGIRALQIRITSMPCVHTWGCCIVYCSRALHSCILAMHCTCTLHPCMVVVHQGFSVLRLCASQPSAAPMQRGICALSCNIAAPMQCMCAAQMCNLAVCCTCTLHP